MKNIKATAYLLEDAPTRIKLSAASASRGQAFDGHAPARNRSRNELGKARSAVIRQAKRSGAYA